MVPSKLVDFSGDRERFGTRVFPDLTRILAKSSIFGDRKAVEIFHFVLKFFTGSQFKPSEPVNEELSLLTPE